MKIHHVRVYPSKAQLPRTEQFAWKIAEVASDLVPVVSDVNEAIIDRIIDNAAVAIAAINRSSVVSARAMALGHPRNDGATILGYQRRSGLVRNGPHGRMARRSANWTCMILSWLLTIPILATISHLSLQSLRR